MKLEMENQIMNNNPMMIEAHNKKGHAVHDKYNIVGSFFSSSSSSSDSEASSDSSSLESDSFEEVTSPTSSSSSSSSSTADPLNDMSSLFQQLPLKRGLSKFYQGKSQSFTSLANVRSLEDLVKQENPYNKKLKSCKSYGGGFGGSSPMMMSRVVSKKGRGSCSSLSARRVSASRPPIPSHSHRSTSNTNIPNQTALFA